MSLEQDVQYWLEHIKGESASYRQHHMWSLNQQYGKQAVQAEIRRQEKVMQCFEDSQLD